jgi:hypothetical protein
MAFPPEISSRFVDRFGDIGEVSRHVMLEAFAADVFQKLL